MNKKQSLPPGSKPFMFKLSPAMLRDLKAHQSHCSHPSLSYSIRKIIQDHLSGGKGSIGYQLEIDRQYDEAFGRERDRRNR